MASTRTDKPAHRSTLKVQLPWESVGDDDAPAPVNRPDEASPDAATKTPAPSPGEPGGRPPDVSADRSDSELEAVDYELPVPAEPLEEDLGPALPGGGWTVALLCAGVAIIACCVLIPQADANRRLAYEREKLKVDLESIRKQAATNDDFLRRVSDDPNLAERLAQRQMKIIREGTRVLELKKQRQGTGTPNGGAVATGAYGASAQAGLTPDEMSPFHLVHVAPPPPLPPYKSVGGRLAGLCYNPRTRLYLTGIGLFLMAAGLVLGVGPQPRD